MLWLFVATPTPPLINKKLKDKIKITTIDFSQIGVSTNLTYLLTITNSKYKAVIIRTININKLNKIGDEALEAKASFGVSIAKESALALTLLPHSL